MQSELDPLWLAAYSLAGKLLAASVLNLPIVGDFTIDGTAIEDDYRTPAAACTTLTLLFAGAVAASIYQTGTGAIPDYNNLQAEAMADINVGDIARADPWKQKAWQAARNLLNTLVDRLDMLADDLFHGNTVDAKHLSLQFNRPDSTQTAMRAGPASRVRQSSVATSDLVGNRL